MTASVEGPGSPSSMSPSHREMLKVVMCMDRVPSTNNKGASLGPASALKEGRSTFGAAPRFGKPLYMGQELRKEQALSLIHI